MRRPESVLQALCSPCAASVCCVKEVSPACTTTAQLHYSLSCVTILVASTAGFCAWMWATSASLQRQPQQVCLLDKQPEPDQDASLISSLPYRDRQQTSCPKLLPARQTTAHTRELLLLNTSDTGAVLRGSGWLDKKARGRGQQESSRSKLLAVYCPAWSLVSLRLSVLLTGSTHLA